jgi:MFS family permease
VLAAVMLPAGLFGDRLGRKKVLLVALVRSAPPRRRAPTRAAPAS